MSTSVSSVASMRLPEIQHPLTKLGNLEMLSLTGCSTDRNGNQNSSTRRGRPMFEEEKSLDSALRSQSSKCLQSLREEKAKRADSFTVPPRIPKEVEVILAPDRHTPRLPIFGQRVAPESRANSRVSEAISTTSSSFCPGGQLRIQVDQLEHKLRQRTQAAGSVSLKNMFKSNNPEGKAAVNRDVLLMVLTKFLGTFISVKQFRELLLRLHLSEKAVIGFDELCSAVREPVLTDPAAWLSPARPTNPGALLRASQALSLLRGPARTRFLEAVEYLPIQEPKGPGWMVAAELKSILGQLEIHMQESEFDKLWKRFDIDALGAVRLKVLLKKLGLCKRKRLDTIDDNIPKSTIPSPNEDLKTTVRPRTLSKAEEDRHFSITMETWLKDRFREGVQKMKVEFERLDPEHSGKVGGEEFLQVLRGFDLRLKREHLGLFLARCGMELRKDGIDYPQFLLRFLDRSQDGLTHSILSNPKHRFHQAENISHASSITAVEAKLTQLFQSEYLSLLQTFQSIDKFNKRTISQEEFRAAVESRFGLEISEAEFEQLLDRLPLDAHGNVQYPIFMAAFETSRGAPSLFQTQFAKDCGNGDGLMEEGARSVGEDRGMPAQRWSVSQLFHIIKRLVTEQYQAVERVFHELDEKNTRRLTQETMYQLLKRFLVHPEVSRGQIRQLWASLITQQDGTLDFLQFARHFGPSLKSSRFPNAKRCPPQRGDENLRQRSKRLTCLSDILVDAVHAKVEHSFHDLQMEFEEMDPYRTGFVSPEEFKEVLSMLCSQLDEYECDVLARKFDINRDGRVSYSEFLRPFAGQKQAWRNGSNMAAILQSHRENGDLTQGKDTSKLGSLNVRLKKKLQRKRQALRRAFLQLDVSRCGLLSVPELRAVLMLCGVSLDQEDLYQVLSLLDQDLGGHVDYRSLLQEISKPPQQRDQ
ncbi:EF-hand calcium-binding domain-containing protein 6 [Alosa sapidissima]|uniref:EF-hand calcium-binding domain-containing protein 6 n=1 Tax=Alosa sapidissima TaxID=34773 RepID=UPI001C099D7F|nr:EF-hand calcium-binding domain-containing protein 6 [Alosa sapidissima]